MTIEQPVNQKDIKISNIIRICEQIFLSGPVTRSDLAEACGLSLMTAGKIADLLKKSGIVAEKKEEESLVGRKAGFLFTAEQCYVLVLDLSKTDFEMRCMRVDGQGVAAKTFFYQKSKSYAENLEEALSLFAESFAAEISNCLGLGVVAPSPYDAERDIVVSKRIPALSSLPVKETISAHFPNLPIVIDEDVKFAARHAVTQLEEFENKIVFYAYIGEGAGGAIVSRGQVPQTKYSFSAEFGQIMLADGKTTEEYLSLETLGKLFPEEKFEDGVPYRSEVLGDPRFSAYVERALEVLVWSFQTITWLIDPDEILVDSDHLSKIPGFMDEVRRRFHHFPEGEREDKLPQITVLDISENAKIYGACTEVRRAFLRSIA